MNKRIGAGLLALGLLFAKAPAVQAQDNSKYEGLGEVQSISTRSISPYATWQFVRSKNKAGLQQNHWVDLDVPAMDVIPMVTFGDYLYGGDTIAKMVGQAEAQGYQVLFAINGDSFTPEGVPKSTIIQDGIIHSNGYYSSRAIGWTGEGDVVYSAPMIRTTASFGNESIQIAQINTPRTLDRESTFLFTDRYNTETRTTEAGVDLVIDITTEGYKGLRIGQSVQGVVNKVYKVGNTSAGNKVPIKKGQVVITTHTKCKDYQILVNKKPGDKVTITVQSQDDKVDWTKVTTAIGVYRPLVEDGKDTQYAGDEGRHPRTSIGMADGGILRIMENDGRKQTASGLSYDEMTDYYASEGYDYTLNFDGGGSSTLALTLPGFDQAKVVNFPSDTYPRRVGNALLFVRPKQVGKEAEKLHLYPIANDRSTLILSVGQALPFRIKATDANYFPLDLDTSQVTYTVSNEIGHVDEAGKLVATQEGKGQLVATHANGATGSLDVLVTADRGLVPFLAPRIAGANRYDTAVRIAGQMAASFDTVMIANAQNYPDALVAAPLADDLGSPILLTDKGILQAETLQALKQFKARKVILLGGVGSIAPEIESKLKAEGFRVERISGSNRFGTAVRIAELTGNSKKMVYLASGENYPDALALTPKAIKDKVSILLTGKDRLDPKTVEALKAWKTHTVVLVGGKGTLSDQVVKDLKDLGIKTSRIAGENRYETSVAIAKDAFPKTSRFYFTTGENFIDALTAGPFAGKKQAPIILVGKGEITRSLERIIQGHVLADSAIIGGMASVDQATEQVIAELMYH